MTDVTLRAELSGADLAAGLGLMMITGGLVLVLRHPAAQEGVRQLSQNPEVRKLTAEIGRHVFDSALRAIGTAALPQSGN